jgi:DNA-binding transcriptional ArsR family regulator
VVLERRPDMARQASLRLFCSHGVALFYIAQHPDCTIRDLAEALVVTRRTVWGLISDLKGGGLLDIRKQGRVHHYRIREDTPFPDPLLSHMTVGHLFQALVGETFRRRAARSAIMAP